MRTTVTIDDNLLADARASTGLEKTSEIVEKALRALIAREAAHFLASIGGTDPKAKAAPRRRRG